MREWNRLQCPRVNLFNQKYEGEHQFELFLAQLSRDRDRAVNPAYRIDRKDIHFSVLVILLLVSL
jgi:hypothetical protein